MSAEKAARKLKRVGTAYRVLDSPATWQPPQLHFAHSEIYSRVRDKDSSATKINELIHNPDLAPTQCPRCGMHVIHQLLRNGYYEALRMIAPHLSAEEVNEKSQVDDQTPFSIACEGRGDTEALRILFDYRRGSILVPRIVYKRKNNMQTSAGKIIMQWYKSNKGSAPSA